MGYSFLVDRSGIDLGYEPEAWDKHLQTAGTRDYRSCPAKIRKSLRNPEWHQAVASLHAPLFDPHWRTSDVVELSQSIASDQAFDQLPKLADALIDAGCADEVVLGHCRRGEREQKHSRVVYLVLEEYADFTGK